MTREEAIQRFNGIINAMSISIAQSKFYPSKAELDELCDMAIEALSADAVSREEYDQLEALYDAIRIYDSSAEAVHGDGKMIPIELKKRYPHSRGEDITDAFMRGYKSAQSVQGEWVNIDDYYRMATCSHCHKVTMFEKWGKYTKPYNFCPNCGARMKGGGE